MGVGIYSYSWWVMRNGKSAGIIVESVLVLGMLWVQFLRVHVCMFCSLVDFNRG